MLSVIECVKILAITITINQLGWHVTAPKAATCVRTQVVTVMGSVVGAPSPLPALTPVRAATTIRLSGAASAEMRERVSRGALSSPLPYAVLGDYDRADETLDLPAIELDNGLVRAVVLPGIGGRVWSLVDLVDDRELVHRNPRLRWANFGLTDAWVAGGIEWNLGSTGHGTTSNLPMHAAVLDTSLGPVVRLWEWERTRDLVLQVDLWLSGRRLMASTRVLNPDPEPKPLYYWTNVAVPETPGTRVLVPADSAWRTDYTGSLERVSVPCPDGAVDISVARRSRHAADYFFEVEEQVGRLVSAVEPDGRGMAETSTAGLHGRKMFVWGDGPGGRRWQDWLGRAGSRYLEVQAGVCTTQLEHDLLEGNASRTWTEAFVPVALDPSVVSADHDTASYAVQQVVHEAAPPAWLAEQHDQWLREVVDVVPTRIVHTGSGWGRAELALRGSTAPAGTPFPEVDDDSRRFVRLVAGDPVGGSEGASVFDDMSRVRPTVPVVSERWRERLAGLDGAGWWVHYALGTANHVRGDREGARTAYERSLALAPTAVALRGLALLSEDVAEQSELYARALALTPDDRQLAVEWLTLLRDAGRPGDVVSTVASLPGDVRSHARVRLVLAQALAELGEGVSALEILEELEVANLAEGDQSLSDLWSRLRPRDPVPERLDFRMMPGEGPVSPA